MKKDKFNEQNSVHFIIQHLIIFYVEFINQFTSTFNNISIFIVWVFQEKLPVQSIGGSVQVEEINPPKNNVSPSRIPKPLVNRTYIVGIKSREYSPISVSVPSKEEQISYTRTPDSIASGSCLSDSTAESLMSVGFEHYSRA